MKKTVLLIVVVLLCAALLAGCGCKHEVWNDANCETPKTCAECGQTEGEALGHKWVDANCETPKTCSVCNKTEGAALGHTWADATCEAPKTCSVCQKTEGEALGHTWADATTEAPKTCTTCQKTDGERIITDPRFTTAACQDLFGTWAYTFTLNGEMMGLGNFDGTLDVVFLLGFSNDGKMTMNVEANMSEGFQDALRVYMAESLYAELELSGVKREDADAFLQTNVGMSFDAYLDLMMQMADFSAAFEQMKMEGNYYVDGDQLYGGESWEELEPETFSVQGDSLQIDGLAEAVGMDEAIFVRVQNPQE